MNTYEDEQLMTARAVAHHIGRSEKTLANWRCEGRGPAFHKFGSRGRGGGAVRYTRADVTNWVARHRVETCA